MPSAVPRCTYLFPLESGCLQTGPEGLLKAGVWPSESYSTVTFILLQEGNRERLSPGQVTFVSPLHLGRGL